MMSVCVLFIHFMFHAKCVYVYCGERPFQLSETLFWVLILFPYYDFLIQTAFAITTSLSLCVSLTFSLFWLHLLIYTFVRREVCMKCVVCVCLFETCLFFIRNNRSG